MKIIVTPVIQVDSLKTKFDTVVVSNSLIALLDHNYNEARFLQQLHYWSYSEYGVVIDGIRWIYKSAKQWLSEALIGLSEWKLRKAISSLLEKNLIRKEKLFTKHQKQEYKSFWWQPNNQTCYYSINYEELQKLIEKTEAKPAQTTENVRFESSAKLRFEETKETKVCELSRNSTKTTNYKELTTKQEYGDNQVEKLTSAAAQQEKQLKEEENQKGKLPHSTELTTSAAQNKAQLKPNKSNIGEETNIASVDYIVNKKWQELIPLLDSMGVPINKTIKDLLKLYSKEKVESAIAIVRARKRDSYIPNPSGYFVSALKGDWGSKELVNNDRDDGNSSTAIDTAAVFRHWYDLARELGYCSGSEVREGKQWICLSGTWEQWEAAVKRGYSLEYLKKIIKRNQGR